MAKRVTVRRVGGMLVPANDEAKEVFRTIPIGRETAAEFIMLRNERLHRKAFAFVNLAFEYWQPKNYVQTVEKETVRRLGKFLAQNGMDSGTIKALCSQFLASLNEARQGLAVEKDRDSFREFITIEAGFYRTVIGPGGPRRVARSWAWKNMPEEDFQRLFEAIRNVCWELVLNQTFESIEEADAVAEEMMTFD